MELTTTGNGTGTGFWAMGRGLWINKGGFKIQSRRVKFLRRNVNFYQKKLLTMEVFCDININVIRE